MIRWMAARRLTYLECLCVVLGGTYQGDACEDPLGGRFGVTVDTNICDFRMTHAGRTDRRQEGFSKNRRRELRGSSMSGHTQARTGALEDEQCGVDPVPRAAHTAAHDHLR